MAPSWLSSRRALVAAFLLVVASALPSLGIGWVHDDILHHAMLTDSPPQAHRQADEVYCFDGGPRHRTMHWKPWWQNPALNFCYFRPLSSLSLAVDHHLFASHPQLAHLHALAWLLLACLAIHRLARRLFDPATATVAVTLYGIANFSSSPVAWTAARHSVVTAALSAIGLALYIAGREDKRPGSAFAGLLLMACALLGGEAAVGGFGFVVAYELLGARDSRLQRLAYSAAATATALAFVLAYSRSGYGAAGSGSYIDPLRQPGSFLLALPPRLFALLADATLGMPSDAWNFPQLHLLLVVLGIFSLLLLLAIFFLRPSPPDPEQATATQFLSLGALLAVIPGTAAILGGRLLMVPGIGLCMVMAAAVRSLSGTAAAPPGGRRTMTRLAIGVLCFGLFFLNPVLRLLLTRSFYQGEASEHELAATSLASCARAQHFYILGTNELPVAVYAPYLLQAQIQQRDWQQLTVAMEDIEVERLGPATLRLRTAHDKLLGGMNYSMLRGELTPLPPGTVIPIGELTLRVQKSTPQSIGELQLELPRSADDPSYCWLRYDGHHLVPAQLPPPGTHLTLPYATGALAL